MALKTFSVQEEVYSKFSKFCKERGINMSKQIELFMQSVIVKDPKAKQEYLKKLNQIREGTFLEVSNFEEHFGL